MDYFSTNKALWNMRTASHIQSDFYKVDDFKEGQTSLNKIELDILGDVAGLNILHLQCHFGQDTLSLARMGAQVVGVDLSDKAIEAANDLANELNIPATFICCNIYDLPAHLNQQFDIVFTSYGTVTWLPDLDKWAGVVNQFLKPSGRFVFAEFHPVVWMFDGDFEKVGYNYFNSGPIIEMEVGTYADRDAPIEMESVGWNHSMMEVVNSLLNQGLQLKALNEYNYSPYNCFKHTTTDEQGNYYIKHLGKNIPMVYSLDMFKSR